MFFIRSATEADLEKVRGLLIETWQQTYTPFHGPAKVDAMITAWHSIPMLRARLSRQNTEFLVADDGRQIAGMAYAALSRQSEKIIHLHQLYVHPLWQRQGIGSDLFAEIETCFPDADVMRLEVTAENDRAVDFYEAHGFSKAGEIDNVGPPGAEIRGILMEKKLEF